MVILGTFAIIHRGYLDILKKYPEAEIYILDDEWANKLYKLNADLRKLPVAKTKQLLESLNRMVKVLNPETLSDIKKEKEIVLISDEAIEELKNKYLLDHPGLIMENGFFYRPTNEVCHSEEENHKVTKNYSQTDMDFMKKTLALSKQSGCFWRQVASIIVKDNKIIYSAYNQMMPNSDECYKIGCIRDNFKAGVQTEVCSAVHSEANCIAQAAKDGVSLKDSHIYVSTFPCPACAKLVALAGIKKCFYHTGWANFDGERIMTANNVEIIKVDLV